MDDLSTALTSWSGVRVQVGGMSCDLGFKLLPAARVTLVVSLLSMCISKVDNTSSFRANHDEVFTV